MKKTLLFAVLPLSFLIAKEIIIDLPSQTLTLRDGNKTILHTAISSGNRLHPTPAGNFKVTEKKRYHKSTLYPIRNDGSRGGAAMNYMLRFNGTISMHSGVFDYENGKSIPMSHGCIRVPEQSAKKLFSFVGKGTRVTVVGKADYNDSFNRSLQENDTIPREEFLGTSNLNLTVSALDIEELEEL